MAEPALAAWQVKLRLFFYKLVLTYISLRHNPPFADGDNLRSYGDDRFRSDFTGQGFIQNLSDIADASNYLLGLYGLDSHAGLFLSLKIKPWLSSAPRCSTCSAWLLPGLCSDNTGTV